MKHATMAQAVEEVLTELEDCLLIRSANSADAMGISKDCFRAALYVFQTAFLEMIWQVQEGDNMDLEDRIAMVEAAGNDLKKLVFTYTNIDTKKLYDKTEQH